MSTETLKKVGFLLIIIAIFMLVILLLITIKRKNNKKNKPTVIKKDVVVNNDNQYISENEETKKENELLNTPSTQEFLPFDDIRSNMIVLPNDEYKMVIETQSITYALKSREERDRIESRIASALQSWDFDFQIYVQTREVAINEITDKLEEDYQIYSNKFPDLREYFKKYIEEMKKSSNNRYKNLIKRHFFIISCNDVSYVGKNLSKAEKDEYALKQLELKANKIIGSLSNVGVVADVLDNNEIIELLYASLNKEKDYLSKNIREYISDFTVGSKIIPKPSLETVIEGFKEQLLIMLKDEDYNQAERRDINQLIKKLEDNYFDNGIKKTEQDELFIL